MKKMSLTLCLSMFIILCISTVSAAGGKSEIGYSKKGGFAMNMGVYNMDSPTGQDSKTKFKIEGEISSWRFGKVFSKNSFDFFATFGTSHLESKGEIDTVDASTHLPAGTLAEFEMDLYDFKIGARFYPYDFVWGEKNNWALVSYFGGGGGYYWSRTTERGRGDKVGGDLFFNYYEIEEDHETKASGFFPFITAGINLQYKHFYVGAAINYDFNKEEGDYSYTGPSYMGVIGVRF